MEIRRITSLLILGLVAFVGSTPIVSARAESALRPGEFGIFLDRAATIISGASLGDIYVVARAHPQGLSRVRFSLKPNAAGGGAIPPTYVVLGPGVVDFDGDSLHFDLDTSGAVYDSLGIAQLVQISYLFNASYINDMQIAPYSPADEHPMVLRANAGASWLAREWFVPPGDPRRTVVFLPGPPILISTSEAGLMAVQTEADSGDAIDIDFHSWLASYGPDPFHYETEPFLREQILHPDFPPCEICFCSTCYGYSELTTHIEWDSTSAGFLSLSKGTDTTQMQLQLLTSSPGTLDAMLAGPPSAKYYQHVLRLSLLVSAPDGSILRPRATAVIPDYIGGDFGFYRPGQVLVGCQKMDVIDDDIIDGADLQAALAVAVAPLDFDDFTYCRSDVNRDGIVSVGDGVLIAAAAAGITPTATSTVASVLSVQGTVFELHLQGAAGAEFEVVAPGVVNGDWIDLNTSNGVAATVAVDDGILRIAVAKPNAGFVRISVDYPPTSTAPFSLLSARTFDETGQEIPTDTITAAPPEKGRKVRMLDPYPNPFNPSVNLSFVLPRSGRAKIDILDLRGRILRQLSDAEFPAGISTLSWNGADDSGTATSSGVYLVRVRSQGEEALSRIVLLK